MADITSNRYIPIKVRKDLNVYRANWETGSTNTVPTISEPRQTDAAAHLYTATITPTAGATDGDITMTP